MMINILIALVTIDSFSIYVKCGPPDRGKEIKSIVEDAGYYFEEHHVTTDDGYINTVYRLFSKHNQTQTERPVALCAHGIMGSGADWVLNGPKVSIAFLLADAGYDVWLFNARGVANSKKHIKYLESSHQYWNFSVHEIGIYDLPATIDYVLKTTGQPDLFYVGLSQGGGILFIMGSLKPEYNKKVRVAALLAPAVYLGHLHGVPDFIMDFSSLLRKIIEKVGHFELFPDSSIRRLLTNIFCNEHAITQFLCYKYVFSLVGDGTEEKDPASLTKYMTYSPTGVSTKQFFFFSNVHLHPGHFLQYDYGKSENLRVYNSSVPPEYPINKTDIPVAIFQGLNDILVTTPDVDLLVKKLPNVIYREIITKKKLNHLDLVYGRDMPELAYYKILNLFEKYQKNETLSSR